LLVLHAVFFYLKRKKVVEVAPHRACCGS
jgi:hypothetical protein